MKHILGARQYHTKELGELFDATDVLRAQARGSRPERRELAQRHIGYQLATLFYEPSTRTRLSFEGAAGRLGVTVLSTENAGEYSSAVKGESIEHTAKTVSEYVDIIVMRTKQEDAAERAAAVSKVPVINGGAGKIEHPTQAVLDLYTIKDKLGRLDNLKVVIGGDLAHGRTVKSLAQMLALYEGNELRFVSTPQLSIDEATKDHLDTKKTDYSETADMFGAFEDADVVYWTRLQTERLEDASIESRFQIGQIAMQAMPEKAILMHPLPIDSEKAEIHPSVESDPRAVFFQQAANGLYVRMAMIDGLLPQ